VAYYGKRPDFLISAAGFVNIEVTAGTDWFP
jgi:hypothetical protein